MVHRNTTRGFLAALLAAAALSAACGASHPEETQLKSFFRAAAMRDDASLANFSVVSFDPKTEGQVTALKIVSVSDVRTEPLKVKDLTKAYADAQAADKELSARKKAYQDAHVDALKRVIAAESANKKLTGPDATVQTEWQKWREDAGASSKKVNDARIALSNERPFLETSLFNPQGQYPDWATADAVMETKDVTCDATVKTPDGASTQKNLVVTMSRVIVKSNPPKTGKWIVTNVKQA